MDSLQPGEESSNLTKGREEARTDCLPRTRLGLGWDGRGWKQEAFILCKLRNRFTSSQNSNAFAFVWILNSNDKIHACDYQNNSCPRALRAVLRTRRKKGGNRPGRGQKWGMGEGSRTHRQREVVGAVPCEERFGMGDADSAAVCMDASQAMLLISHSGTSVHGKLQLCDRNRIKSVKEAGVRGRTVVWTRVGKQCRQLGNYQKIPAGSSSSIRTNVWSTSIS